MTGSTPSADLAGAPSADGWLDVAARLAVLEDLVEEVRDHVAKTRSDEVAPRDSRPGVQAELARLVGAVGRPHELDLLTAEVRALRAELAVVSSRAQSQPPTRDGSAVAGQRETGRSAPGRGPGLTRAQAVQAVILLVLLLACSWQVGRAGATDEPAARPQVGVELPRA